MEAVADGLVARGATVARFHFPYMERAVREDRRRPPNPQKVLLQTWREMWAVASKWETGGTGVSCGEVHGGVAWLPFGCRRTTLPKRPELTYFGYPLHPPGKPEKLRSEHLPRVQVPQPLHFRHARQPVPHGLVAAGTEEPWTARTT